MSRKQFSLSDIVPDAEIENFRAQLASLKWMHQYHKERGFIARTRAIKNALDFFEKIDDPEKWTAAYMAADEKRVEKDARIVRKNMGLE
tara:strand:+ start:2007 stop:2273 length:267 start_codon:yes stop_codon:yes gene_type:complete